mmetsp:Transcript_37027/g.78719  ORF Transcript_37027/g.78719 Transcript_37027/m.78719 type:complete len:223 (+) Transcript_37027:191-859(+)
MVQEQLQLVLDVLHGEEPVDATEEDRGRCPTSRLIDVEILREVLDLFSQGIHASEREQALEIGGLEHLVLQHRAAVEGPPRVVLGVLPPLLRRCRPRASARPSLAVLLFRGSVVAQGPLAELALRAGPLLRVQVAPRRSSIPGLLAFARAGFRLRLIIAALLRWIVAAVLTIPLRCDWRLLYAVARAGHRGLDALLGGLRAFRRRLAPLGNPGQGPTLQANG